MALQPWESREPDDWDSESFRDDFRSVDVHHGDDWYRDTTYTVREAPIRTYVPTCQTFLDVITSGQERSCLHIRARPRNTCGGPSRYTKDVSPAATDYGPETSADYGVFTWPCRQDLLKGDEPLTGLLQKLNPDTATQQLTWYADERSIVYALQPLTGKSRRRIAIISFDPSVQVPSTIERRGAAGSGSSVAKDYDRTAVDVGGLPGSGEPAAVAPSVEYQGAESFGLDFFWRPSASGP